MLPDLLDTYLPTPETKALLLALVKAHAQRADLHGGLSGCDPASLTNEAARAHSIAAWLETVPTRKH